jgi:hypothetical protein
MADPYWVDERWRRLPEQPCPQCDDANMGPLRLRADSAERYQSAAMARRSSPCRWPMVSRATRCHLAALLVRRQPVARKSLAELYWERKGNLDSRGGQSGSRRTGRSSAVSWPARRCGVRGGGCLPGGHDPVPAQRGGANGPLVQLPLSCYPEEPGIGRIVRSPLPRGSPPRAPRSSTPTGRQYQDATHPLDLPLAAVLVPRLGVSGPPRKRPRSLPRTEHRVRRPSSWSRATCSRCPSSWSSPVAREVSSRPSGGAGAHPAGAGRQARRSRPRLERSSSSRVSCALMMAALGR